MLLGRIEKYGHVSINKVLSQHLTHLVLWRCGAVTPESAKDCCCANNPGHISHTVLHTLFNSSRHGRLADAKARYLPHRAQNKRDGGRGEDTKEPVVQK
jgi:hypothetical protein